MEYKEAVNKDILVLGCGNILFGDDGFGSAVADHLASRILPGNVSVVNAGTGVREILFDLVLDQQRPRKIIVIDAVDLNRRPGEIFRIEMEDLPQNKIDDFTLHEMPTLNLLKELKELCHVEVTVIAGQVQSIPDAVKPGLSDALSKSVPAAAEEILTLCDERFAVGCGG